MSIVHATLMQSANSLRPAPKVTLSRGLGRSYGDSALNANGVMLQTDRNRFIGFDEDCGILKCEAGVSIAHIIEHLLPRGWFVPVTPGTKYVTIGGAIAADVHGKNHHRVGSFGNFVREISLLTASGDVQLCSDKENRELFDATIGGMGLTGVIVDATIQLKRVQSAYCDVTFKRTQNLDQTLEYFQQSNEANEYSVAWLDCLARGDSLGRSVVQVANDILTSDTSMGTNAEALTLPAKRRKSVPIFVPSGVINRWTVKAFNQLYYARHGDRRRTVDYDTFFYPLDGIANWNRVYGRRGFIQYQALFPPQTSRQGLIELLECIVRQKGDSFLAVLKSSGPASRGVMSYLRPGHTLALDFPNQGEATRQLVRAMDEVLLKHDGRVYLAKDSMTSAEAFGVMYPEQRDFQEIRDEIDPNRRFISSQARRLKLVDTA